MFARIVGVLAVLAIGQLALAEDTVLLQTTKENKNGSTRTKVEYKVVDKGERVELNLTMWVRKSGVEGTGHGTAAIIGFNGQGEHVFTAGPVYLTVGADALKGTKEKDESKTILVKKEFYNNTVVIEDIVVGADDSPGIPKSVDDVKKMVKDNPKDLADIAKEGSKVIGTLQVFRLR